MFIVNDSTSVLTVYEGLPGAVGGVVVQRDVRRYGGELGSVGQYKAT